MSNITLELGNFKIDDDILTTNYNDNLINDKKYKKNKVITEDYKEHGSKFKAFKAAAKQDAKDALKDLRKNAKNFRYLPQCHYKCRKLGKKYRDSYYECNKVKFNNIIIKGGEKWKKVSKSWKKEASATKNNTFFYNSKTPLLKGPTQLGLPDGAWCVEAKTCKEQKDCETTKKKSDKDDDDKDERECKKPFKKAKSKFCVLKGPDDIFDAIKSQVSDPRQAAKHLAMMAVAGVLILMLTNQAKHLSTAQNKIIVQGQGGLPNTSSTNLLSGSIINMVGPVETTTGQVTQGIGAKFGSNCSDPLQEGGSGYKEGDIVDIGGGKYCKVNDVTGETENYKYIENLIRKDINLGKKGNKIIKNKQDQQKVKDHISTENTAQIEKYIEFHPGGKHSHPPKTPVDVSYSETRRSSRKRKKKADKENQGKRGKNKKTNPCPLSNKGEDVFNILCGNKISKSDTKRQVNFIKNRINEDVTKLETFKKYIKKFDKFHDFVNDIRSIFIEYLTKQTFIKCHNNGQSEWERCPILSSDRGYSYKHIPYTILQNKHLHTRARKQIENENFMRTIYDRIPDNITLLNLFEKLKIFLQSDNIENGNRLLNLYEPIIEKILFRTLGDIYYDLKYFSKKERDDDEEEREGTLAHYKEGKILGAINNFEKKVFDIIDQKEKSIADNIHDVYNQLKTQTNASIDITMSAAGLINEYENGNLDSTNPVFKNLKSLSENNIYNNIHGKIDLNNIQKIDIKKNNITTKGLEIIKKLYDDISTSQQDTQTTQQDEKDKVYKLVRDEISNKFKGYIRTITSKYYTHVRNLKNTLAENINKKLKKWLQNVNNENVKDIFGFFKDIDSCLLNGSSKTLMELGRLDQMQKPINIEKIQRARINFIKYYILEENSALNRGVFPNQLSTEVFKDNIVGLHCRDPTYNNNIHYFFDNKINETLIPSKKDNSNRDFFIKKDFTNILKYNTILNNDTEYSSIQNDEMYKNLNWCRDNKLRHCDQRDNLRSYKDSVQGDLNLFENNINEELHRNINYHTKFTPVDPQNKNCDNFIFTSGAYDDQSFMESVRMNSKITIFENKRGVSQTLSDKKIDDIIKDNVTLSSTGLAEVKTESYNKLFTKNKLINDILTIDLKDEIFSTSSNNNPLLPYYVYYFKGKEQLFNNFRDITTFIELFSDDPEKTGNKSFNSGGVYYKDQTQRNEIYTEHLMTSEHIITTGYILHLIVRFLYEDNFCLKADGDKKPKGVIPHICEEDDDEDITYKYKEGTQGEFICDKPLWLQCELTHILKYYQTLDIAENTDNTENKKMKDILETLYGFNLSEIQTKFIDELHTIIDDRSNFKLHIENDQELIKYFFKHKMGIEYNNDMKIDDNTENKKKYTKISGHKNFINFINSINHSQYSIYQKKPSSEETNNIFRYLHHIQYTSQRLIKWCEIRINFLKYYKTTLSSISKKNIKMNRHYNTKHEEKDKTKLDQKKSYFGRLYIDQTHKSISETGTVHSINKETVPRDTDQYRHSQYLIYIKYNKQYTEKPKKRSYKKFLKDFDIINSNSTHTPLRLAGKKRNISEFKTTGDKSFGETIDKMETDITDSNLPIYRLKLQNHNDFHNNNIKHAKLNGVNQTIDSEFNDYLDKLGLNSTEYKYPFLNGIFSKIDDSWSDNMNIYSIRHLMYNNYWGYTKMNKITELLGSFNRDTLYYEKQTTDQTQKWGIKNDDNNLETIFSAMLINSCKKEDNKNITQYSSRDVTSTPPSFDKTFTHVFEKLYGEIYDGLDKSLIDIIKNENTNYKTHVYNVNTINEQAANNMIKILSDKDNYKKLKQNINKNSENIPLVLRKLKGSVLKSEKTPSNCEDVSKYFDRCEISKTTKQCRTRNPDETKRSIESQHSEYKLEVPSIGKDIIKQAASGLSIHQKDTRSSQSSSTTPADATRIKVTRDITPFDSFKQTPRSSTREYYKEKNESGWEKVRSANVKSWNIAIKGGLDDAKIDQNKVGSINSLEFEKGEELNDKNLTKYLNTNINILLLDMKYNIYKNLRITQRGTSLNMLSSDKKYSMREKHSIYESFVRLYLSHLSLINDPYPNPLDLVNCRKNERDNVCKHDLYKKGDQDTIQNYTLENDFDYITDIYDVEGLEMIDHDDYVKPFNRIHMIKNEENEKNSYQHLPKYKLTYKNAKLKGGSATIMFKKDKKPSTDMIFIDDTYGFLWKYDNKLTKSFTDMIKDKRDLWWYTTELTHKRDVKKKINKLDNIQQLKDITANFWHPVLQKISELLRAKPFYDEDAGINNKEDKKGLEEVEQKRKELKTTEDALIINELTDFTSEQTYPKNVDEKSRKSISEYVKNRSEDFEEDNTQYMRKAMTAIENITQLQVQKEHYTEYNKPFTYDSVSFGSGGAGIIGPNGYVGGGEHLLHIYEQII